MNSITNEIELMEEVSDWLKNWAAEAPPVNDISRFISHRSNLLEVKRKIDKILLHLKFNRPDVANVVEEKWKDLVNLALADLPNGNDLNESTVLAAIGSASLLANTLRDIAKLTREELGTEKPAEPEQKAFTIKQGRWNGIKRIPRWICLFVGFLAALLTCIYIIWWLWTTFFV